MCLQAMEKNIKKILRKYLKRKRVGEKRLCNWREKVLWVKGSAIGEVQVLGRKELRIWRDKRVGNGKGVIFE